MYETATFLVNHFWGKPADMADGLGVLLLTWNQAFYRYGPFDFQKLEDCIGKNELTLDLFRRRNIVSYILDDDAVVKNLFDNFLDALRLCEGPKKGTSSPVAVAKALHLLGPSFFPLWDAAIAKHYGCPYSQQPAQQYILFLRKMKEFVAMLGNVVAPGEHGKSLLKLIDEYNYARFTKHWI